MCSFLNNNSFTGTLPSTLGNLINLTNLCGKPLLFILISQRLKSQPNKWHSSLNNFKSWEPNSPVSAKYMVYINSSEISVIIFYLGLWRRSLVCLWRFVMPNRIVFKILLLAQVQQHVLKVVFASGVQVVI